MHVWTAEKPLSQGQCLIQTGGVEESKTQCSEATSTQAEQQSNKKTVLLTV